MADSPHATLEVPEREISKSEEARQQDYLQRKQKEEERNETRKLTKREFHLVVLIVLLTLVICGLVGFIIGWFLWPHAPDGANQMTETDGNSRSQPVDIDDVRIVKAYVNDTDKFAQQNITTCLTSGCLKAGLSLLDKIDPTADPCRDFRAYACGKVENRNAIFPTKKQAPFEQILQEKANTILIGILQSKVTRIGRRSSERKVKRFYSACMDVAKIKSREKRAVLRAIDGIGGWPAVGLWSGGRVRSWALSVPLEKLHFSHGVEALFSWRLLPDPHNSSNYTIQLGEGGLTLPDREVHLGSPQDAALVGFRKAMRTSALLLGASAKPVNRFVYDVASFEKKLALISTSGGRPAMSTNSYNRTTIRTLIAMSPEVDWRSFFRHFPGVSLDTEILLDSVPYFTNLSQVVSGAYPRILQNYMAWRYVLSVSPYLSSPFREGVARVRQPMADAESLTREKDCLEAVNMYMGQATGALVAKDPSQLALKKKVKHMAQIIKELLVNSIDEIHWMDDLTKTYALEKALALRIEVGFPNYLRNTALVDSYYADFHIQEDQTFFETLGNVTRAKVQKVLETSSMKVDQIRFSWDDIHVTSPAASYLPQSNTIVVPLGIIQPPFYESSFPVSMSYGSLGAIIGREMLKSLVDTGADFDMSGVFSPWWTNETEASFDTELKCVTDSLRGSALSEQEGQENSSNETFAEIAEIAGLKLSYTAWSLEYPDQHLIPGANLTSKQTFFVSFAQSLCDSSSSKSLFKAVNNLDTFRLDEFREVFDCIPDLPTVDAEQCALL